VQFRLKSVGLTQKDVADKLGVSTSAVSRAINEIQSDDFNLQNLRLKIINLANSTKLQVA
jgi:predicted transcriptional regulator